jgi:phosphatidylglycerophosphatase A
MLWTIGRPHIFSPFAITLLFVGSILGWRAILHILRFTSEKDPPYIVIDEFLGQLLALICVPDTQIAEIGAFLLFRFFDIKKKGGIRSVDLLSKRSDTSLRMAAACIIGDDLLAGLYAGILVRILGFCMAFL